LTNNCTVAFEQATRPPETIDQAVDRLMLILNGEQKTAIAALSESELITLHFSLGMAIRNAFGLHEPNSRLLAACGVPHPDDAAGVIVRELWGTLIDTHAAQ